MGNKGSNKAESFTSNPSIDTIEGGSKQVKRSRNSLDHPVHTNRQQKAWAKKTTYG